MPKAWITRTAPFNRLTARYLRQAGLDPLVEPALRVKPLPLRGPIAAPDALVFTSLQGVRLHRFFPSLAELPVFAVGTHTARLARMRGYRWVASAAGDVHDLRQLIRARLDPGAAILHLSAARPAGDLVAMLSDDGYQARRQVIYQTVEASEDDLEDVASNLKNVGAILIHSPRAGSRVAAWLKLRPVGWSGLVCCISDAAAAPFQDLANVTVAVAARPNERGMMDLCKETIDRT